MNRIITLLLALSFAALTLIGCSSSSEIEIDESADSSSYVEDSNSQANMPPNEGEGMPEGGERPEGEGMPEGGERPEGEGMPEGVERPEGEGMPEGGERPEGEGRPLESDDSQE